MSASIWYGWDTHPSSGRKIVALFNDGSGATLFWVHDDGVIDCEGLDMWGGWESGTLSDRYSMWAYLPDTFEFFCEQRSGDPMTLKPPLRDPTNPFAPLETTGWTNE